MPARYPSESRRELKRLLIVEANLHRAVLCSEWQMARSWLTREFLCLRLRTWLTQQPIWGLCAGVATAWLASRRWKRLTSWVPAAYALWRWWRRHGTPPPS